MKKAILLFVIIILLMNCKESKTASDANTEEWMPLFNGKDLNDWDIKIAGHQLGDNYLNTFRVEDSMLRVKYDDYDSLNNAYGHIYYKTPFSYYKIKLDYRFVGEQVKGGEDWAKKNNGIMYHAQSAESNSLGQFFPVSIELQFLGGLNDENERPTANLCTPGTTVEMSGQTIYDHCVSSNSKTYNREQWVHLEAIIMGSELAIHIVDNDTVMTYQNLKIGGGLLDPDNLEQWKEHGVDNQDEWLAREGEPLSKGYIALQAESHPTDFKNIELLNLCGCMDKKAKNYKSYFLKADNSTCIYE